VGIGFQIAGRTGINKSVRSAPAATWRGEFR
jgi:hypothetical protein